MRLYSPDIAAAGAQYLSIVGENGIQPSGRKALEGARQRLENPGIPADVVAEIEQTRKAPLYITWKSPRGGTIVERNVVDGMRVQPGDVLFRIVDHSLLWVIADVTERDLAFISKGQTAIIRPRGFPGQTLMGKVDRIYPRLTVEVLDGLQDGDRVVVSANFLIDAESNLNAALQSMTSPETRLG